MDESAAGSGKPVRSQAAPSLCEALAGDLKHARTLLRDGRLDEAGPLLDRLLAEQADNPQVLQLAATLALERKDRKRAIALLARAIAIAPKAAKLHASLGHALRDSGRADEAITAYGRAISLDPRLVTAQRNLGHLYLHQKRYEDAVEALEATLALNPQDTRSHHLLGNAYRQLSRSGKAVKSYRRALQLDPDFAMARFGACIAELPVICDNEAEVGERRAAYERGLQELRAYFEGKPREILARAAPAVGTVLPFYLAYQGRNDRDLQCLYGELVCRIMAAALPQWSAPLPMPRPEPDGRLRVGVLSGYFRWHSNWKMRLRGWAEQLDRTKLRLYGYYTQGRRDGNTTQAESLFDRFVVGPKPIADWAEIIRADDLHALIIPEIGMDTATARLAALRLAPVQCGSWGHPETSGYPTMDYFLSSALMEPANGQEHYRESLVTLPNLSLHYIPPKWPQVSLERAELGLREDSVAYWCCQSLFKYRPGDDDLFPRIAADVGNAQFVFLRSKWELVNRRFQVRLAQAFTRFGLEAKQHCVFLDPLRPPRFAAAMRQCDVFLDSLGWSGCNSALEAMSVGLPVITCPGELMRGRHSAGFLTMMGLEQAIAPTAEDYVELAISLGRDAERRIALRRLVQERQANTHGDLQAVRALEDFLCQVAGAA